MYAGETFDGFDSERQRWLVRVQLGHERHRRRDAIPWWCWGDPPDALDGGALSFGEDGGS